MAVSRGRSRRRSLVRRLAALTLAAGAYGAAVFAAASIVRSALAAEPESGVAGVSVERVVPPQASTRAASEVLAMRTLAARAQRSVYELEAGAARGSAVAAWTAEGRTFFLTSRAVVIGAFREGERRVFLRRGQRVWGARIWTIDARTGLAVVRADGPLGAPLWQRVRREPLAVGDPAIVVAGGPAHPLVDGAVTGIDGGRLLVAAPAGELSPGAAVVSKRGRLAGIVSTSPGPVSRVTPVAALCAQLRRC